MKENIYVVNATPKNVTCDKLQYNYYAIDCYRIPYQVATT